MIFVVDEMTCLFSVILNIVKDLPEGWFFAGYLITILSSPLVLPFRAILR